MAAIPNSLLLLYKLAGCLNLFLGQALFKGQVQLSSSCNSESFKAGETSGNLLGTGSISRADLLTVLKPSRYLGGEHGCIIKDDSKIDYRVCLAFPDLYEVGMSHLGLQILYELMNRVPGVWAERVYSPWPDMEALIRNREATLWALESKRPLHDFDILGFSLQFELCLTNLLAILDLGKIPLLSAERNASHPLIIAGGPLATHPEPLADFVDAFLIGDGEELALEFVAKARELKVSGASRENSLKELGSISGVYIPALKSAKPVRRRILATLSADQVSRNPLIANVPAVHDRLGVEVMRGCIRGCRFCQAGYIYRPQRERPLNDLLQIVENSLEKSGLETVSLLSLSTADYGAVVPLVSKLTAKYAPHDEIQIALPSSRVDAANAELLHQLPSARRNSFTLAPEAGTQRLRNVINKGISDDDIMQACRRVFELGWKGVKLYFMIGLPTETDDDLAGIVDIAKRVREIAGKRADVTINISTFVPKPHTPFHWAEQISEQETIRRHDLLYHALKRTRVNFRYHDAFASFLEGVFARGDRSLGPVLLEAYKMGSRFEAWTEHRNRDLWLKAFAACGIEPAKYLKARNVEDALPWDHIDCEVSKSWLAQEWQKSLDAEVTENCIAEACSACGVCDFKGIKNVLSATPEAATPPAEARAVRPPEVQRIRLRYQKKGAAAFLSHLDILRSFGRAMRRAEIPIAYSRGYNPRPRLGFGPPLQLGIESESEYVDVYLTQQLSPAELLGRINATTQPGLDILEANEIDLSAPSVQAQLKSHTYRASPWLRPLPSSKPDSVKEFTLADGALFFSIACDTNQASIKPYEVLRSVEADPDVELRKMSSLFA